jgi:superfamily I DNA/RNA helicase
MESSRTWRLLLRRPRSRKDLDPQVLTISPIYSVKRREFPTVVVVLPQDLRTDTAKQHVLDHWDQGTASEARRVLYVGASRAQTLLILAVHTDHANRVAELLKRDGIPYDLGPLSARPAAVAPDNYL